MVSPAMEKKNAESFYLSLEMGTVRENSSKVEFQVRGGGPIEDIYKEGDF